VSIVSERKERVEQKNSIQEIMASFTKLNEKHKFID
jgi:hypothetical protein